MTQGTKTPIEPGLIARLVAGIRYTVSGVKPDGWFSPSQPITPAAQDKPDAVGRAFDYPTGYNLRLTPRAEEAISFSQLRALADGYDLLRLIIETRKDSLTKLDFVVQPMNGDDVADARCKEVMDFLRFPDREHTWDDWLRMVIEDLLVIDAPTLYPRMTKGGALYAIEPVDGSTIKRVIDGWGRTPEPPDVAYQQVIKGLPSVDYSRDELIYKPRNLRTHKVYGYSPVEQVIMTVNIALRRQIYQLQYYTEGSTPDMILSVPDSWNPDQIKQFYDWWQSMLAGNTAGRAKTMFVPNGVMPVDTKEKALKDEFDEWLARVVCYAFGVSPTPFVKQVNRATAQVQKDASAEEGVAPMADWVKNLIDGIIWRYFGYTDLEFTWATEKDPDLFQQAQINQIYLATGVKQINEVRAEIGLKPLSDAELEAINPPAPPPLPSDNPDDEAMKIAKAASEKKKPLPQIKRDRPALTQAFAHLKIIFIHTLNKFGNQVAKQVIAKRETLGKAANYKHIDELLDDLDLDWNEVVDPTASTLTLLAVDAAKQAIAQMSPLVHANPAGQGDEPTAGIGISVDLVNERAVEWAKQRAAEMVGKRFDADGNLADNPNAEWRIDESTRDGLRDLIAQAEEEGWSNDQLSTSIQDAWEFSTERADMIARTETASADMQGNMITYQEAQNQGLVLWKRWVVGDGCCDLCQSLDGKTVALDDNFEVDVDDPPLHPNCRCDIVPVVEA